jgi:Protein of unknown function (DUF1566)
MKLRALIVLLFLLPLGHAQTPAPSAVLRIACEGDALDADVHINGIFKGQCPVDVAVPEGSLQVRVTKALGTLQERSFEQTLRMVAGTAKRIDVLMVAKHEAALQAAAQAQAVAKAQAECEKAKGRMQDAGGGMLKQVCTGLLWTRTDNGSDIAWTDAQAHCSRRGAGWRLPTVEQLQSLIGAGNRSIGCGEETCSVSDRFSLSSEMFWSSDVNRTVDGTLVSLSTGDRGRASYSGMSQRFRALCVRNP